MKLLQQFLIFCFLFISISFPVFAAQNGLTVSKIELANDKIKIRKKQLIEITFKNRGNRDRYIFIRLQIRLPNNRITTYGKKYIRAIAGTETKVLFSYRTQRKLVGIYQVGARVYSSSGKYLFRTHKQNKTFLALGKNPTLRFIKKENGQYKRIEKKRKPVATATHAAADLVWKEIKVIKNSILRGESTTVRVALANEGGELAQNVSYNVYWFFVSRPSRKVSVHSDTIRFLAPGEKKVFEVPVNIPVTEQAGAYKVRVFVDRLNQILELNEKNNTLETKSTIQFSDISLEFPSKNFSFAEEGFFFFEWRSTRYSQFKLQISTTPDFNKPKLAFELPQGDKWTYQVKITPLSGEMPLMAVNIMKLAKVNHLYWRIIGRNSQDQRAISSVRKFYINPQPR
ncbi:MAG: hypothetical protein ACI86H_000003 [bacterium]|jgi:hypothetical protein